VAAIIIDQFEGLGSAVQGINVMIRNHGADIPALVWADVSNSYPSPVAQIATCAEAFYAMGHQLADGPARTAAATLAAQLAAKCVEHQFYAIGQTERGGQIGLSMRRVLGDDTTGQLAADDPYVLPAYVA
jgi:hypothetical protein